ncbi:Mediator of RNA polymerase II transcription subunit 15a, partial [Mucuna pruriens]
MDTDKMKPTEQQTKIETVKWKLPEYRRTVLRKWRSSDFMEAMIKHSDFPLEHLSGLAQHLGRFEAKVNATAKNEVQMMNSAYFPKLNAIYQEMIRKLQKLESSPQEPTRVILKSMRRNVKSLERILTLLRVSKGEITTEFKEKLDRAEKIILHNLFPKNVSSHQGQLHSAAVQSSQQSAPSHSSISPMEIVETTPSPHALGTQSYHMMKDVSQQNKMCLQKQQVAKQNNNSQQDVNQLSIIKGPGNAVQQQTQGAQKPTEAFNASVNTRGISASPLIENCNNHEEISHKPTLTSDDPSAAMQHFLKLNSISPEALRASIDEIRQLIYLNDVIAIDTSRICASSCDSVSQLTDAEKPDLTSVTSKINHPRIVEINNLLIDSEVVIGEKDSIQSAAAELGEGLVIKLLFNAVTVNQNLICHLSADRKSIIKPLWLLVPTSYPFSPPVFLDKMLSDVSDGPKDLSTTAKSKLRSYLQFIKQPWSIGDIAISWERSAREVILEYAQGIGGGTFSSQYGGWEMRQY